MTETATAELPLVAVELYGIPRARAGRDRVSVQGRTVAEALAQLVAACPGLIDLLQPDGSISPHYLVSINGRDFDSSSARLLQPGDALILLSADPGG